MPRLLRQNQRLCFAAKLKNFVGWKLNGERVTSIERQTVLRRPLNAIVTSSSGVISRRPSGKTKNLKVISDKENYRLKWP